MDSRGRTTRTAGAVVAVAAVALLLWVGFVGRRAGAGIGEPKAAAAAETIDARPDPAARVELEPSGRAVEPAEGERVAASRAARPGRPSDAALPGPPQRWLYAATGAPLGDPPGTLGSFTDRDEDALGAMNLAWKKLARSCYEQATVRRPGLRAAISLQVTVVGDAKIGGVVESAELLDGGAPDDPLVDCVRESLLSLPFPPPRGGDFVRFRFDEQFGPAAPEPDAGAR